ncbi:MAG TPA: RNA polymerase-associated protein RapA [Pseudomonadales bacterium]
MQFPVPGQRFISESEPELGLGQVLQVAHRTLSIGFDAAGETRQYAVANAPITRLRFDAGEVVFDRAGIRCIIESVAEHDGLLHYAVRQGQELVTLPETELSPLLSLSQPVKRLMAVQVESPAWFRLRRTALDALGFIERSRLLGLCSGRTELLPHQLYIAREVAQRPAPRVLLSDEVGLGKTIEACLILQQQLFSGLAQRVLILVPDSLVHQWLVELLRRFNLRFSILDDERCKALTEVGGGNPFESAQLVLCPRSLFRMKPQWFDAALNVPWDLLIADEAHHLLVQGAQDAEPNADYAVMQAFSERVPGLLLLTATPDQAGLRSHFGLLQLLDPRRFHDFEAFVLEQQAYIAVAELLDPLREYAALDDDERAALLHKLHDFAHDAPLRAQVTHLASAETAEAADAHAAAVTEALLDRHGTGRIVFRNTRRNVSGFPQRHLHASLLDPPPLYTALAHELQPEQYYPQDWLREDPRVGWLDELLRARRGEKFLIICRFRETAVGLEETLRLSRGVKSAVFHEDLTLVERDRAAAWFADADEGAQALVCSEIGSEGRNFQFCQHLVLFDLPGHPDLLEQRIGRLDRIGQRGTVNLHVPCFRGTAQGVLLKLYDEVLNVFTEPNPVAAAVCARVADLLAVALRQPDDATALAQLMEAASAVNAELLAQHAAGRDKLLELNSCRPAAAQKLQRAILKLESGRNPRQFLEEVFSAYGLDFEINSNRTWNVTPGDDMLVTSFPQIPDDGTTFTLDRELALARDDLPFVTWLHPLVLQSLDLVLQDNPGKVSAGVLHDKRLPRGTLVLESLYRVTITAPPRLQARRWFPTSTLRAVVDSQKRSIGKSLTAEQIDVNMNVFDKDQLRALVRDRRDELQLLARLCQQVAERQLPELIAANTATMHQKLDAELERLEALQAVNPQVQDSELDYLRTQRAELTTAFSNARVQLEALRLLLVV